MWTSVSPWAKVKMDEFGRNQGLLEKSGRLDKARAQRDQQQQAAAGAYHRPLFSSTGAVSDTKYTLNIP
jgi:hypothetical protein